VRSRRTEAQPGSHDVRHWLTGGPAQPVGDGDGSGVLARFLRHGDRRGAAAAVGAESPWPAVEAAAGRTEGTGYDRDTDQLVRRGPTDRRAGRPVSTLAGLLEVPAPGSAQFGTVRAEGDGIPARQSLFRPRLYDPGPSADGRAGPLPDRLQQGTHRRLPLAGVRPPGSD